VNRASGSNESVPIGEGGLRSLRISPDGKFVATGDRVGNVRVHNLDTLKLVSDQEAHNAEVLSLAFTTQADGSFFFDLLE